MGLQVYSTLTRKKEPFHKQPGETVTMYVCGPTVYKPSHIGHMVGPVIFDTVKRYLTYLGYKVKFVVNITDVDDKLIARARELNTTVPALAEQMTQDYFTCLKALNVTGIDHFPRATQHIKGMIDVIRALEAKGYAYELDDGVYFDVSKDDDYGKLTNRDPEQMEAGARLEPNAKKRNPGDFALWKSKPGEPAEVQFESPFKCGRGRPGWHIECTCMAIAELGETLDIHGGGLDLQFPHHENELAQSESLINEPGKPFKPFARIWMHNGLLKMGSAKMAGSVGNVVNIADLLVRHSAETVRFLLLSSHYRSPIEYSEGRLEELAKVLGDYHNLFTLVKQVSGIDFYTLAAPTSKETSARNQLSDRRYPSDEYEGRVWPFGVAVQMAYDDFLHWMNEDFNTASAIARLNGLRKEIKGFIDDNKLQETPDPQALQELRHALTVFKEMTNILGLFWAPPREKKLGGGDAIVSSLMQLILDVRNTLRTEAKKIAAKDDPVKTMLFDQATEIRKRLEQLGVIVEDRPGGTTWRVG